MIYKIIYTPKAKSQLVTIYDYICDIAAPHVALKYTGKVIDYCEDLNIFPMRGSMRDDLSPGLRITNYKKTCVIAFRVREDTVTIIGIFYGGQDYEFQLANELDD